MVARRWAASPWARSWAGHSPAQAMGMVTGILSITETATTPTRIQPATITTGTTHVPTGATITATGIGPTGTATTDLIAGAPMAGRIAASTAGTVAAGEAGGDRGSSTGFRPSSERSRSGRRTRPDGTRFG